jgi:hypothetical protein
MDCREFRDRHAPFVDLMCSAFDENEMRQHMRSCQECARHDMVIRRSLMLVRSLPTIEVSEGFRARLDARLREAKQTPEQPERRATRPSFRAFAAVAASLAFLAISADVLRRSEAPNVLLSPVIASLPEPEPSAVAAPAMVAAVPTGMSVWPAIMLASQAQMHFVAAELATER